MTDQTAIVIVVLLAAVVIGLFVYNARQKKRFEQEQLERRRKLDQIKAEARAKEQFASE
ncbi:MAG: hypothetical protein AAFP97_03360 [Pseudomonadota bacterium]